MKHGPPKATGEKIAELTPSSDQLLDHASDHPAPDDFWRGEDNPSQPPKPPSMGDLVADAPKLQQGSIVWISHAPDRLGRNPKPQPRAFVIKILQARTKVAATSHVAPGKEPPTRG